MSFAIWKQKPPFRFAQEDPEQIYQVGSVWVVTDDPSRATQTEVDKVLNATVPASDPSITQSQLRAALVGAGLTEAAVSSAMTAAKA